MPRPAGGWGSHHHPRQALPTPKSSSSFDFLLELPTSTDIETHLGLGLRSPVHCQVISSALGFSLYLGLPLPPLRLLSAVTKAQRAQPLGPRPSQDPLGCGGEESTVIMDALCSPNRHSLAATLKVCGCCRADFSKFMLPASPPHPGLLNLCSPH